jgi:ornithine decarboxylase
MPDAKLHFMNPVKPRDAIRLAYSAYGVRTFVLDTRAELDKIVQETNRARDLTLYVRIAVPNQNSAIPLDRKFGTEPQAAIGLLKRVRRVAQRVGISFHVGSQMLRPQNYNRALAMTSEVAKAAGVALDCVDVGGGFPARHPGDEPPHLSHYVNEIRAGLDQFGLASCHVMSEPGRALVAEAESVIVKVIGRRDNNIHVNDGTYGCFFEGAKIYGGLSYPARLIRNGEFRLGEVKPFALWGPSCDSIDHMPGPFYLPDDVREGDYLEIGQLGAYGRVSRSDFNGFGAHEHVIFEDPPMLSMYDEAYVAERSARAPDRVHA